MLSRLAAIFVCVVWCAGQDATNSPAQTLPAGAGIPPLKQVVVVTGTYEPVPLEESDRDVEVIEVNQDRLLFDSLADYLRLDSSVDLRERAPGGIQGDLSIRGGTFGQSLVLLNGMRLNDPQSGHHNMDLPIPPDVVSEMQVLGGSGSTQYGSDAVAGVLNILTRAPDGIEVRLRGALGNYGINEESGSVSAGNARVGEQLVFARDLSTGFENDRDYRDLSLASISHISSALGFTDVLLALSDRPFGANDFYGPYDSWERTKGWFASARQELGKNTEVDFAYRRHTDLFVLFRENPAFYTNRHEVEDWQGAVRRSDDLGSAGQLHYGVEIYNDSIASNNLGYHARTNEAGYVSWDMRVLKRFSFTAGLRDEAWGSFNNEFSPTIAAGYWLSSKVKLRASGSHAFRLPTYTDLYYHDPTTVGYAGLKPERAWQYEGGVDWFVSQRLRASATVFQRRDRDLIDYVLDPSTNIYVATNFDRVNFTGFEGKLEWRPRRGQSVAVEYTGLRGVNLNGVVSRYVFNYPVNTGVVAWQGGIGRMLVARTRIGVVERYAADPYALWDASVARANGRVRPFLQLSNITSTEYQEIAGVNMPKRTVVGGVEVLIPSK
ncbi:MAG TPA: TonB-dependent receptor [Bryobacteraceae bacterium]|nr:TonB-dependent receptor [Bryobacteraceae bacterium]